MKHILIATFITLLALGMGCAWISPASETASDGIQVHGHWTVTVTNPDGTLDAVHEFDNAFRDRGILTSLLTNSNRITSRYIRLNTILMDCSEGVLPSYSGSSSVEYLEAETTIEIADKLPFTLSATCKVEISPVGGTGFISGVFTSFYDEEECVKIYREPSGSDPYIECTSQPLHLTSQSLSPPLEVSHGQKFSFNVRISFQ